MIALKNRRINDNRPKTPRTSVSKKPSAVLWRKDGANARKSAANKPTDLPPMSLPIKYSNKQDKVPKITGKNEQNIIKSILTPNQEIILYNIAAVIGREGSELRMGSPLGYHCW